MALPSLQFPIINGLKFDFSSCEINLGGVLFKGIKSINYKHSLDPGIVRGNRAGVAGRTRGTYTAEGSIEFFKAEYDVFIATLLLNPAYGYMEAAFDICVNYSELFSPVVTDILTGCRIKSEETQGQEGNDAIVVSCDLSVMQITSNGKSPLGPKQRIK